MLRSASRSPVATLRPVLRACPGARRPVAVALATSAAAALVVLVQVEALGRAVAAAVAGGPGETVRVGLLVFVLAVAARLALAAVRDAAAERGAARVASALRHRVLARVAGGRGQDADSTLLTTGVDAVHGYLAGYLPRVVAAVVLPVAALVRLMAADPGSAAVVAGGAVLVVVFGGLVGVYTRDLTAHRMAALGALGGQFVDALRALPGLRAIGRAGTQVELVARSAQAYRRATAATLRTAFLSALVAELVAAFAVALVAVPIGLRLLAGAETLATGLVVLLLVPEVFAALRAPGAAFHEATAGMAVAERALDQQPPARPAARVVDRVPDLRNGELVLEGVWARYPDAPHPVLRGVHLRLSPGERVAVRGASGAGKSSLLAVLLGLLPLERGAVLVDGVPVPDPAHPAWRAQIGWLPQAPQLTGATLRDGLRLGRHDAADPLVWAALRHAAVDDVVAALPGRLDTPLGADGHAALSVGQRQRLGLARAALTGAPLLLLDEPSAHLDPATERRLLHALAPVPGQRCLTVTHRAPVAAHADRVLRLSEGTLIGGPA